MSEIDKRVVQMVFDNEDFEKNIAKSKKSLESMDDSLDNIEKSVSKKVIEKTISSSIEKTELKIQALKSVIDTVVSSITSSVIGSLSKCQAMINNLTFDQISKGFGKYEEKLTSVQTIMNATGDSIGYVEEQMAKLMWYTDETSYNFSDMANNIGKFTAVGVDLDKASSAMQGIANWAGLAGQNAQAASRAMYNISQAMSAGYMKQQDWASIQNASMDTQEFRRIAFNTAKELAEAGKYTALSVEWFNENTANDFFSDLGKNKNFTTDVLMATLAKFSSYSDEIHRMVEEEDMTTIEAMDLIGELTEDQVKNLERVKNQFGETSKEMQEEADKLGVTITTAANIANTGWEAFDLGRRAFEASQMYKTFKDVIDATADAASSSWMRIYQQVFGNLEQAKEFWTELGGIFYEVFVTPVEKIVEVLEAWNSWSGREMLLGIGDGTFSVFQELYHAISDIIEAIQQAFLEMNPFISKIQELTDGEAQYLEKIKEQFGEDSEEFKTAAEGLKKFVLDVEKLGAVLAYYTNQLRIWIWQHRLNTEQLETLRSVVRGLAVLLKGIGKVIYSIGRSVIKIYAALFPSFDTIIKVLQSVDENAETVDGVFNQIANTIYRVANIIAAIIKGFKQSVMDGTVVEYLSSLGDFLIKYAATYIRKFITNSEEEANGFINIIKGLGTLITNLASSIVEGLVIIFQPLIESILAGLNNFVSSGIGKAILTFISEFGRLLGNTFVLVTNLVNGLVNLLNVIIENVNILFTSLGANEQQASAGAMATIIGVLALAISYIMETIKEGKAIERMSVLNEIFENIGDALNSFTTAVNAKALEEIGKAVALIALAMLMVASIPREKLGTTLKMVGGILITFMGSLALISSLSAKKVGASGLIGLVKSFQQLAVGMMIFAAVILKLMKIKPEELLSGIISITSMLTVLVIFIGALNAAIKPGKTIDANLYKLQIEGVISIMKSSIILAVMINVLRSAMISIGKMETGEFVRGIIGLIAIMSATTFMVHELSNIVENATAVYRFNKNIMALSGAVAITALALNILSVPLIITSFIPTAKLANGILTMLIMVGYISLLFGSLTKFSKDANENQAKTVASAALAMLSLAAAINLIFVPLMALTAISMINKDALNAGLLAFTKLTGIILLFIGGLALISGLGKVKVDDEERGIVSWITIFEKMAKDMLLLAGSITAFMVPLIILGVLSKLGIDVEMVLLDFAGFLLEIFTFMGLTALVTALLGVDDAVVALALGLLAIAGSVAALAGSVYLLSRAFEILQGEINLEQFRKNGKIIGDFLIDIILIISIIAGLLFIFKKKSLPILSHTSSGKKETETSKVAISLGQEILALGTGLMMISLAISALMIPIKMLSNFEETEFYLAAEKMKYILIALGIFIGSIMLAFGLMSRMGGNNTTGWSQTATTTDSGISSIFKRGRKKVSIKEATSFGANMKELGKALLLFAASITLLIVPMKLIGMIPDHEYNKGLIAISSILGLIILMVSLFGAIYGKDWDVKKMILLMALIGVITGVVIGIVTTVKQLAEYMSDDLFKQNFDLAMKSVLFIGGFIGLLTVVAGLFGKKIVSAIVQRAGSEWALFGLAILEISAGIALIAVAMNKLMTTQWSQDWPPKLIAMTVVIIAVYGLFGAVYGLTGRTTGKKAFMIATAVLEVAAAIFIMAGAITLLAAIPTAGNDLLTKLGFLFAFLVTTFLGLGIISETLAARDMIIAATSVAIVAGALLAISAAMVIVGKSEADWKQMLGMAGIIVAIFAMLAIVADITKPADLILAAASFAIVAGSVVLLASSLAILGAVANSLPNGWDDLYEGVGILMTMTVAGMALIIVVGAIIALCEPLAVGMIVASVALGIVALAFIAIAAAIWIVIQALIDLGGHWDEIERGLNNITTWLTTHKEEWKTILTEMFSSILSSFGVTLVNMQDLARVSGEAIARLLVDGISGVKDSWKQMFAEAREAKDLASRQYDEFRKYQEDAGVTDMLFNSNANKSITQSELDQAMANMIKNNPNASNLTYDELKKIMTARFFMNGKGFSVDNKANKVFEDNDEMFRRAYYNAGGRLYMNGKWYDQFHRDYENYGDTESGYNGNGADTRTGSYKDKLYDTIKKGEIDGLAPVLSQDGEVIGFIADDHYVSVEDSKYAELTGYYDKNYNPDEGGMIIDHRGQYGGEEVSAGAGQNGDGVPLVTSDDVDKANASLANAMAPGQVQAAQAGAEIYGNSFIDTLWSFFANGGNFGKTLWTEFNNSWLGKEASKAGDQIGEWWSSLDQDLKDHGVDFGKMKDDALDHLGGYFGFDTTTEEYKDFKKNFTVQSLTDKASKVVENVVVNKQDLPTALKNAGVSAEGLENNMIMKMIKEAAGVDGLFGGEETDWEDALKGFKIKGIDDIKKTIKESTSNILGGDAEEAASNYAAGVTSGLDTKLGDFNYQDILDKYHFNDGIYDYGYGMGTDQALGQIDAYDQYMKDFDASKYTDKLSDYKTALGDYGKSSESNLIWRGYGRNGEELWAPSKEDMYNNLVKPIRDGFEWHGWDAEGATPWKAVETAADAMKDAAETEKTIITDAKKQRWELDEAAGKWYAIDENGKRINKTDAEGKESPWSVPAQKQDAKIQNGVWVWDATNKQWILTVNGKYADLGNGIQLADTKSGILDTPTLTDAQYQALTAKMANDEKKKTADQRKNDLLYGDLDKKIQAFTNKEGKQLYYGDRKVEATDYETGKKRMVQKKYALRGKKLAGYDNAYALVDEKGNLIFNSRGERITFTVDKTNGVNLMSESMTQAANTMNEAGKEVQNAAKNPNTKAAMYGASTAVGNAEATKDVYSTAVVHNQDTGLVESKYNNNVVAQNQSNQQAQDATQSAKSAIDHLQEINSKMTEVRDLMISNNMMLATIEALNMNMDKSMKDASARPLEFNIDGKKVAEATKGFMNKSLGVVSRMGGRQVAT